MWETGPDSLPGHRRTQEQSRGEGEINMKKGQNRKKALMIKVKQNGKTKEKAVKLS